ncbi:hypothetical protein [uncultured Roseibium sp.]|uniref:hypothetical protein n=1 Tax=uncultured Roseibium sp. TaxID=1936171 RepID=UPI0032170CED
MYTWIETTFGFSDGLARGLVFAMALAVVLALFALFVFIIKWAAGARNPSVRSRQPRLAIMDSASVDTRRRLVLIRRDNIEHLILIGGPSDVVVEQGIIRGTPLAAGHPRQQPHLTNGNTQMPNMDGLAASVPPPVATPASTPYPEPAAPVSPPATATSPVEAPQRSAPIPSSPGPSSPGPSTPVASTPVASTPLPSTPLPSAPAPNASGPTPPQPAPAQTPTSPAAQAAPEASTARAAVNSGAATVSSLRSRLGDLTKSAGPSTGKPQTPPSREQPSRTGAAVSAFSRTLSAIKPQETGKKEEGDKPGQPERREPQVPQASAAKTPPAPQVPQPPRASERRAAPASSGEPPATGFARTLAKPLQSRPAAPKPVGPTRTVSPPSSGPAAKALTAFPKGPLEERKEPVMEAEPAPAVEDASEAKASPPLQSVETKPAEPAVKMEAPAVETPAAPARPAEAKAEPALSPPPSDEVSVEAPAMEQPAAPEITDKPEPAQVVNRQDDVAKETAVTEKAKTEAAAAAEDARSEQSSAAQETVPAETKPKADAGGEPAPDTGTAADEDKTSEGGDRSPPAEAQTAEVQTAEVQSAKAETKAADQDTNSEDKKPENGQPSPDAKANPIEDEMAKLLDEIHGNQKA